MPDEKRRHGGLRVDPKTGKPLGGRPRKPKNQDAGATVPAAPKASTPIDPGLLMRALPEILEASKAHAREARRTPENNPFQLPWFPKAALPPKNLRMAMDSMPIFGDAATAWLTGGILNNVASEAMLFPGYTYLSQLAQQPDFRNVSETIADDATRKWIKYEVVGDEKEKEKRQAEDFADPDGAEERRQTRLKEAGKADKVKALTADSERLRLRDHFYALVRDDGFFGRVHLYLNFGNEDPAELKTPIGDGRNDLSRGKVDKSRPLKEVKVIEPVWCYPTTYNANNPLADDWYNPQVWYVMGREIHASRMLRFMGRPVPDLLKPAYSFGGISLSQLVQPSIDLWIQSRNSVAALIHGFSVFVLETDLQTLLQQGSAGGLIARAALFNALRDNQGLFVTNKTTEGFNNVAAPIAGLSDLQAQAQEHVASTGRIPLVKYTGLQPKGLNASAEGEIAVYDDTIGALQNRTIRPVLSNVFYFQQLSLFGEIDPGITFEFEPLRVMTEKEKAEKQKMDAERDGMRLDQGAISPEEIRGIIVNDPELPYTGLDPDDVPEPPDPMGGMGEGGDDPEGAIGKGGKPPAEGGSGKEPGAGDSAVIPFAGAHDAWSESEHPRGQPGNAGQFGPGGGSSKTGTKSSKTSESGPGGHAPQFGLHHGVFTAAPATSMFASKKTSNIGEELDTSVLKKVGAQKGSNPGGVYEDDDGKKFYVKQGKTKEHVRNEMIAAALYDLAGTPTLSYRPTKGGTHIATEIEKLDKDNASKLSPAERSEAARDFAVHAWLANWDAVGLGGDNLGTIDGVPTALDLGGALEYRAQGAPKGKAFGTSVGELDTLRDGSNKDAAGIFGDMTPAEMRESARYVTKISDGKIKAAVEKLGGSAELADKLIARKNDIAQRARLFGAKGDPSKPDGTMVVPAGEQMPLKSLNGVSFKAWKPPEEWADVDGQAEIEEPEFEPPTGKKPASGVVIREPDGRVWLVQPTGGYGGYEATFPKGRVDEGLSLQANAIKEAYEESGLKVRIVGHAGDHEGDLTYTRYYYAEREGGDPSKHEDESEGVVLAPVKDAAANFLNRKRDRQVLAGDGVTEIEPDVWMATDAHFEESKHPRDAGGKFSETAGGGGSEVAEAMKSQVEWAGNLAKKIEAEQAAKAEAPAFASKKQHVAHLLQQKGGASVADILKATGWAKISIPPLAASVGLKLEKVSEGGVTKYKGTPMSDAEKAAAKEKYGAKKPAAAPTPAPTPPPVAPPTKKAEPAPAPPPAPSKFTPTAAELEKAKKNIALKLQFVPGAPQTPAGQAAAQKLVDAFNAKYANKEITSPAGLIQKVADFKLLTSMMGPLQSAEQKAVAEQQAKAAEEAKKNAAELAAKAKAEAKRNAEKNATVMKDLGISDAEAEGFNALVSMLGGKTADVVAAFKGYEAKAEKYGYPITGFQAALISNYSNGGYAGINDALRTGAWSTAQHVYVKMVNKALSKMPAHTGTLTRNTTLTAEQLSKYNNVGKVIMEDAFMSTSTGSVFSGNVQFKVSAIGKRGASIKKLSQHSGENEVLFQARTFFKIDKVDKSGGETVIHMTEWEE